MRLNTRLNVPQNANEEGNFPTSENGGEVTFGLNPVVLGVTWVLPSGGGENFIQGRRKVGLLSRL